MELDTFAQKLRYLRLERNLDQREFAKLLNRGFTTVCNWEQGIRIPKLETIKEIADILNVDYTFFKRPGVMIAGLLKFNIKNSSLLNKG